MIGGWGQVEQGLRRGDLPPAGRGRHLAAGRGVLHHPGACVIFTVLLRCSDWLLLCRVCVCVNRCSAPCAVVGCSLSHCAVVGCLLAGPAAVHQEPAVLAGGRLARCGPQEYVACRLLACVLPACLFGARLLVCCRQSAVSRPHRLSPSSPARRPRGAGNMEFRYVPVGTADNGKDSWLTVGAPLTSNGKNSASKVRGAQPAL